MIHVIIGGSMAGKSTYVLHNYLMSNPVQFRQFGITVTGENGWLAIGPYANRKRGQGIDAVSHTRGWMHTVLSALREASEMYDGVIVEGNNIQSETFFDLLIRIPPLKMIYLKPSIEVVRERAKVLNEPWNKGITQTYERAAATFNRYKTIIPYEIHS